MGIVVAIAIVLVGGGIIGRLVAPRLRLARGTLVGALVALVVAIATTTLRLEWRFWVMAALALVAAVALWPEPKDDGPRTGLVKIAWLVPPALALGLELRTGLSVPRAIFAAVVVTIAQAAVGFAMVTLTAKRPPHGGAPRRGSD
ncbi:MAG: hypothetical protein JNL38_18305 [Myxococcales bacterium]|nr:hypothetical protein [Myxococcales bacterium]